MAIKDKPKIKPDMIDAFVDGAKADGKPQESIPADADERKGGKPQDLKGGNAEMREPAKEETREGGEEGNRIDAKEESLESGNADERETSDAEMRESGKKGNRKGAKAEKKIKMSFTMSPEMYMQWKAYELKKLQTGEKVTFQGVVEKYLKRILS